MMVNLLGDLLIVNSFTALLLFLRMKWKEREHQSKELPKWNNFSCSLLFSMEFFSVKTHQQNYWSFWIKHTYRIVSHQLFKAYTWQAISCLSVRLHVEVSIKIWIHLTQNAFVSYLCQCPTSSVPEPKHFQGRRFSRCRKLLITVKNWAKGVSANLEL